MYEEILLQQKNCLLEEENLDCSVKTIGRRLLENHIRAHRPAKKVALTPHDLQRRKTFAQAHVHHPSNFRNTAIFCDGKTFSTNRVWSIICKLKSKNKI